MAMIPPAIQAAAALANSVYAAACRVSWQRAYTARSLLAISPVKLRYQCICPNACSVECLPAISQVRLQGASSCSICLLYKVLISLPVRVQDGPVKLHFHCICFKCLMPTDVLSVGSTENTCISLRFQNVPAYVCMPFLQYVSAQCGQLLNIA